MARTDYYNNLYKDNRSQLLAVVGSVNNNVRFLPYENPEDWDDEEYKRTHRELNEALLHLEECRKAYSLARNEREFVQSHPEYA